MTSIALFQPEIAQNVGTIIRLAACFNMGVDLIHPLGFIFSSKHLKRAGMDYITSASITHHDDFEHFLLSKIKNKDARIVLFDTQGQSSLYDFTFKKNDILLFGKESTGVPSHVLKQAHETVHVPIQGRSLNLAVSCSIAAAFYRNTFHL